MIDEAQRNCRNCAHCYIEYKSRPGLDCCLCNGGEYCDFVMKYKNNSCKPGNLIHWAPKPPTLWEQFINLFSHNHD